MRHSVCIICLALAGCGQLDVGPAAERPGSSDGAATAGDPAETTSVAPPPPEARDADTFDTTTAADRAAALEDAAAQERRVLGRTVVSLGDPARPGFWLSTPLAEAAGPGRVVLGTRSVAVRLEPVADPERSGSRLSLAAMRLLDLPLTALTEVEVVATPGAEADG